MTTVNNRLYAPQATVINGIDAGGLMSASIQAGFDNILKSSPDGLAVPLKDKEVQYVRGTVVTQDCIHAVELLIGALGTYVFYERKSGVAEATGYIKHTITNPVIYSFNLSFNQTGYATCSFSFECRAADETKGIADMWTLTEDQAAPAYISAALGGWRVKIAAHGALSIYHVTSFNFSITMNLVKACNDADIAYTCVDARVDGMICGGNINFQDSSIATGKIKAQQLLVAAAANLVLTVVQSQGAADKVITIAKADFNNAGQTSDANAPFTGFNANFDIANSSGAPLTLAGTNKIITIEDAA